MPRASYPTWAWMSPGMGTVSSCYWCTFAEAAQTELNETLSPKGSILGLLNVKGRGDRWTSQKYQPHKTFFKVIIAQQHSPYSDIPTWPRTAFAQPWRSTCSPSEQHADNMKSRTAIPIAVAQGLWSSKSRSGQNAAPWSNPAIPKPVSQAAELTFEWEREGPACTTLLKEHINPDCLG